MRDALSGVVGAHTGRRADGRERLLRGIFGECTHKEMNIEWTDPRFQW
jgi:hypothetical protein